LCQSATGGSKLLAFKRRLPRILLQKSDAYRTYSQSYPQNSDFLNVGNELVAFVKPGSEFGSDRQNKALAVKGAEGKATSKSPLTKRMP
jgi:hypothetical protein